MSRHGKSQTLEYLDEAERLNRINCIEMLKDYIDEFGEFITELPATQKYNFYRDGILVKDRRIIKTPHINRCIIQERGSDNISASFLVLSDETKAILGIKEKNSQTL